MIEKPDWVEPDGMYGQLIDAVNTNTEKIAKVDKYQDDTFESKYEFDKCTLDRLDKLEDIRDAKEAHWEYELNQGTHSTTLEDYTKKRADQPEAEAWICSECGHDYGDGELLFKNKMWNREFGKHSCQKEDCTMAILAVEWIPTQPEGCARCHGTGDLADGWLPCPDCQPESPSPKNEESIDLGYGDICLSDAIAELKRLQADNAELKADIANREKVHLKNHGIILNRNTRIAELEADNAKLKGQINILADYYLNEWPDEIKEGGACENAVRHLKQLKAGNAELKDSILNTSWGDIQDLRKQLKRHEEMRKGLQELVDYAIHGESGTLNSTTALIQASIVQRHLSALTDTDGN